MKNALDNIKKLPNVTAKEASEMRKVLRKEFKQAEVAAKKAEVAQTKAMKKTAIEAKKAATEMRKLKKESNQLGGAVQATGDLIGEFDPALAGMASTAAIAGMAIRDLGKVFLTGNPVILAAVAAIGGAVMAYQHFAEESQRLETAQGNVITTMENANIAIRQQAEQALNAAQALDDQRANVANLEFEYKLLTGQVTQFDAEMRKAEKTSEKAQSALVEAGAAQDAANKHAIKQQKRVIKSLKELTLEMERQGKNVDENDKKTDGYLHTTNTLAKAEEKLIRLQEQRHKEFDEFSESAATELVNLEEVLKKTAEAREEDRKRREAQKNASKAANKQARAASKQAREDAKEKSRIDKEEQKQIAKLNSIYAQGDIARSNAASIETQNKAMRIGLIENEIEKINELHKFEKEQIQASIEAIQQQQLMNLQNATLLDEEVAAKIANKSLDEEIAALKEQQHVVDMQFSKERLKAMDEEKKKRIDQAFTIAGYYTAAAEATSTLIKTVSGEDKRAAMVAFRISQAAAIADIAMTTATKIMQVAPNPFAIAGVSALGALQGATVLAQSPPEAHMGGFISKGEDTRDITVLTGEAVIDRRTVERLGGERGINELQRTGATPQPKVIVMNPFKHFDRYAKASIQRGGMLSTINKNSAAGGY